ncbi:hypothetical protein [Azospirillum doebereinerae]
MMTNEERKLLILVATYVKKDIGEVLMKTFGEITGRGASAIDEIDRLIDVIQRQSSSE